jgi:hypothetical protein
MSVHAQAELPNLLHLGTKRKVGEVCPRENKKKSMTDSIDNIQERTSCAMSAASTSVRSAESASGNKCGVVV